MKENTVTMHMLRSVAAKQKKMNFTSHTSAKSTVDRSENSRAGSVTTNTNLFAFAAKSSLNIPR